MHKIKISKNISSKIWSLFFDEDKRLWIGGSSVLSYMAKGSEKLQKFNIEDKLAGFGTGKVTIYSFYQDQTKRLWALTSKGVLLLDAKKGILACYSSARNSRDFLPAIDFRHMHQYPILSFAM